MSIDDSTSENTPVIKSRTGKFLQGIFDKKTAAPPASRDRRTTPDATQSELIQVVPEQTMWDESEESNWDDDFVEAPQPAFVAPQTYLDPVSGLEPVTEPSLVPKVVPPPPPSAIKSTALEILEQHPPTNSPEESREEIFPSSLSPGQEAISSPMDAPAAIEVSIPRPKNIKYKTKDPNAETLPTAPAKTTGSKNEAIELDIQRPKNIKYKSKSPVKVSLPNRLLAPIKSLFAKIQFSRTPKASTEQSSASESSTQRTNSWQLPFLGRENFRQVLGIAGALFLAMTVAWSVINFWPRPTVVTATSPPAVQLAPVLPPISPEAALVEAVKNRSQTLASLYPAGLIFNLELDADQKLATVIVGDLWFSLTPEQQQQTAQSLWQQAHNYQMSGLEVRAMTDRLLARSPFVGTEAVLISK